jgi:hypothetical protein
MLQDYARWGWKRQVRVERAFPVNGRPTTLLAVEAGASPERMLFLVDRQTDLPVRIEAQLRQGTGWTTRLVMELSFDGAFPDSVFAPAFPEGTRIRDLDAGKQDAPNGPAGEEARRGHRR